MVRMIALLTLVVLAQGAPPATLAAKRVNGHVQLSAEQQKTQHSGCVNACKPSPVESKCVTACEAAMYKCIDETGPNETPEDTKKCEDGVIKKYTETKGLPPKKEEKKDAKAEGKKDAKKDAKKEEKKAKAFIQMRDDDDEEADEVDGEAAADAGGEAAEESTEADESEESENTEGEESEESSEDEESFVQTARDIDDGEATDDAEEQDVGTVDADADKQEAAPADEEETPADEEQEESFLQTSSKNDDDGDAADVDGEESTEETEAADADSSPAEPSETTEDEESEESFVQVKRDVDDAETEDDSEDGAQDVGTVDADAGKVSAPADEQPEDEEQPEEESFAQTGSTWKPEPCGELAPGVPCTHLYEHPQGSTVVMPCPVDQQANPESCGAYFGDKADGTQCPQITCPKALGVTMKLTCGGGCCPTCWAPDHVIKLDRHTSVDDAAVVDPAPQAPGSCSGVKCFQLNCAAGHTEGHVNGNCCYSCVPGR